MTTASSPIADVKVTRPMVRYHGGKWRLAPWIISHFPPHRIYCEPFGGGASVLLRKPRSYAEVYNDLDGEIVNLFRVARDDGDRLVRECELTPFARDEFIESYQPYDDPLEQARRTLVRSFMGFASASANGQLSGFRANCSRSFTTPAHDWMNYPQALARVVQRLRGVVIENRDAVDVMRHQDSTETLHYVDPPYVLGTRRIKGGAGVYKYEMSDDQHHALADALHAMKGMVILSGYRSGLYDDLYSDWTRIDKSTMADGARPRVESLWVSTQINQDHLFQFEKTA